MTLTLLAQNYSHNNSLHDDEEISPTHESRVEHDWWDAQDSGVDSKHNDYYSDNHTELVYESNHRLMVTMLTIRTWVGVISLLCNVYFLMILMRDRSLKATLRTIFVTSAVNDLVLQIVYVSTRDTQLFHTNTIIALHFQSLRSMFITVLFDASTVFLITMAVHQYLDVAKKHLFSRHVTLFRVFIALLATYFMCIAYRTPEYFETEFVHHPNSNFYDIIDLWFVSSKTYVIFKIISMVTFEIVIPFSSLAFITVQLKRSASTQSSDRNASRDTLSFPFDSIVTAVIVSMAIAGCIFFPLRPLFYLTVQVYHLGYDLLYFDHYNRFIPNLIFTLLQAFTTFKLLFYHVARRRMTGISCWCGAEHQYVSFTNTDHDEQRSLDTITVIEAIDDCSSSDRNNGK